VTKPYSTAVGASRLVLCPPRGLVSATPSGTLASTVITFRACRLRRTVCELVNTDSCARAFLQPPPPPRPSFLTLVWGFRSDIARRGCTLSRDRRFVYFPGGALWLFPLAQRLTSRGSFTSVFCARTGACERARVYVWVLSVLNLVPSGRRVDSTQLLWCCIHATRFYKKKITTIIIRLDA